MRVLTLYEKKRHGCQFCLHVTTLREGGERRNACPFDECQYPVLDKYESYEQFMASEDSKIPVAEFFTSIADCYEFSSCGHSKARIFSDGDHRVNL